MNNRALEIRIIGHRRSFKVVLFESLGAVSYSSSIVVTNNYGRIFLTINTVIQRHSIA